MRVVATAIALASCLVVPLGAQSDPPRAAATRIEPGTIRVDGQLDDAPWLAARFVGAFTQRDPDEGAPALDQTEVTFAFDDHALFVAARMRSRDPAGIRALVTRRDAEGLSESLAVSLDTYFDRRTAYTFVVTAAGGRLDYYHPRDDGDDRDYSFDPVWDAAVARTPEGWTAELRIPFSQLRFRNTEDQRWGLNVRRRTPARNADDFWVLIGKKDTGWSSRFGELTGIRDIPATRRLELLPYVAVGSAIQTAPDASNPFSSRLEGLARVGGDLKLGLGPNLTLEAAVNPDFGQVEADPAEVNLSAFESVFSERRPFFVEGGQLLRGGDPSYFYSRRIGAVTAVPVSGAYVDRPDQANILGAVKLTGRLPGGLSIGLLGSVSDDERARTADVSGQIGSVGVAPLTSFGVMRLQQQFGASASTAGLILTHVRRSLDGNLGRFLPRQAITGSADWNLRFRGGEYSIRGDVGFSHVIGDHDAITRLQRSSARYYQRPDAARVRFDPGRTTLSGYRAILQANKNSGRHWLWNSSLIVESPGFELNDLGRISGVDQISADATITYRETTPGRVFRQWSVNASTGTFWNFDGARDRILNAVNFNATWPDFSQTTLHYHHELAGQSATATRGGPLVATPYFWDAFVRHTTDPSKRISGSLYALYDENALGRHSFDVRPSVTLRPGDRWRLSADLGYTAGTFPRQYVTEQESGPVETYGRRYVMGVLQRRETYARFRLNYSVSPNASLETYFEPFASTGDYLAFGEVVRPRSHDLRLYGRDGSSLTLSDSGSYTVRDERGAFTFANPDFSLQSFRSNVVLRWEWRRGSTLYAVWQQDRSDRRSRPDPVGAGSLLHALRTEGTHRLLVKVAYWLSP